MGHQIIKQPNGKYAIFSTGVDQFIAYNMEREDLVGYYTAKAMTQARKSTEELIDDIEEGQQAYYQFTLTFGQACDIHADHGGPDIRKEMEK